MSKRKKPTVIQQGRFPNYPRPGFKRAFERFARSCAPTWGDEVRSRVELLDRERSEVPDWKAWPINSATRVAGGELRRAGGVERAKRLSAHKAEAYDLMDLWERIPKVIRFSSGAMDVAMRLDPDCFDMKLIDQVMPSALLLDFPDSKGCLEDETEGLFIWPRPKKGMRPALAFKTFPDAKRTGAVPAWGSNPEQALTELECSLRAKELLGSSMSLSGPFGMRALGSSSMGANVLAGADPEKIWKGIEAAGAEPFEMERIEQLSETLMDAASAVWCLLAAALGGWCETEQVREGDVDVLIVRTSAERRAEQAAAKAASKAASAASAALETRRDLAEARAEIARLKSEQGKASQQPPEPAADNPAPAAASEDPQPSKSALDEQRERADALEADLARATALVREADGRARAAQARAETLEARASVIDRMVLPLTCASAAKLAQDAYPDRILLLPSAMKSATAFNPRRADEVFCVLRAMALHLHPLLFSQGSVDVMREFKAASGFDVAVRDAKGVRASPKLKRARRFRYKNRTLDMVAHVKGASSRPGEALRVHYALDPDEKLIVIGWCGEHLTGEVKP